MLAEYPIHTALPATDLERAKRFYADKLGLTPESEGPDGLFYRCGEGTRFLVFPSGGSTRNWVAIGKRLVSLNERSINGKLFAS
jgi:catechol 2,3-dioxygenase-like lactoylglutathione lyase family enzyme